MARTRTVWMGLACLLTGTIAGFGIGYWMPRPTTREENPHAAAPAERAPSDPFLVIKSDNNPSRLSDHTLRFARQELYDWRLRANRVGRFKATLFVVQNGVATLAQETEWARNKPSEDEAEETWRLYLARQDGEPFYTGTPVDTFPEEVILPVMYLDYGKAAPTGPGRGYPVLLRGKWDRVEFGPATAGLKERAIEPGKATVVHYFVYSQGQPPNAHGDLPSLDALKQAAVGSTRFLAIVLEWHPAAGKK